MRDSQARPGLDRLNFHKEPNTGDVNTKHSYLQSHNTVT